MDIQRLVIANPSGNTTAIVFDATPRAHMREVGAKIQGTYPSVEQVLFVEQSGERLHGQMAGGEFCGNAARALGYVLSQGREGKQSFTMSGASAPVTVQVGRDQAALSIRMPLQMRQVSYEDAPVTVVHLEGISHAILTPEHPLCNFLKRNAERPDRWRIVTHVLEDLDIIDKPASGLIFAERNGAGIGITPYVYVKEINTLYPEMACASGSIAVAHASSGAIAGGAHLTVHQPSGEDLRVSLNPCDRGQTAIEVAGAMTVLWDGPAADLQYSAALLSGRHGTAPASKIPQPQAAL